MNRLLILGLLLAAPLASPAEAAVRLHPLFTDGAVLQRGCPVPVWGTAEPDDKVTVTFAGQRRQTQADADGRWTVTLAPLSTSRSGKALEVRGSHGARATAEDVLVGEVWLCSGQSNMRFRVSGSLDATAEIAAADHPGIRLLTVGGRSQETPQLTFAGRWQVCSPATVGDFSAVGYFFGRHLHQELEVPVGLIGSSVGGTPAEAWTSRPALLAEPALAPFLARWDAQVNRFDPAAAAAAYAGQVEAWKKQVEAAKAAGKKPPPRPRPPIDPRTSSHRPAGLYNGFIAPLVPFALRGAIWYQGESNAGRAHQYRTLFPLMIRDWRRAWGREDLPFHFVQLANFRPAREQPTESDWAELRDAQLLTLRTVPGTGMAVITDIGDARDIHPKNKQDVGKRLALWALARDYGKKVEFSGPLYLDHEIRGREFVLRFDHVGDGLEADGELRGFAIAGPDRKFFWGNARIEGETIVVSHPDVPAPAAVRYAWADNPPCSLRNAAGLPASPFRTDDWPGLTEGRD